MPPAVLANTNAASSNLLSLFFLPAPSPSTAVSATTLPSTNPAAWRQATVVNATKAGAGTVTFPLSELAVPAGYFVQLFLFSWGEARLVRYAAAAGATGETRMIPGNAANGDGSLSVLTGADCGDLARPSQRFAG